MDLYVQFRVYTLYVGVGVASTGLQFSGKLSKLWISFSLCNYLTYKRIFQQRIGNFNFLGRNPIFGKNTKVIVHGFSKMGFLGMKRNRTVSCQDVRLCVLNLHTKNYSHIIFIYPIKLWICMCSLSVLWFQLDCNFQEK